MKKYIYECVYYCLLCCLQVVLCFRCWEQYLTLLSSLFLDLVMMLKLSSQLEWGELLNNIYNDYIQLLNKTRTMHITMFWVSCFFRRPILQQKWVRNDTSPFHILMQLGKLIGFGLLNRKALQKISKISVFNFLKWKKIQISRAQRG